MVKSKYLKNENEQKFVYYFTVIFVISYFIVPQYVGLSIVGFDLTVNRAFLLLFYLNIFSNSVKAKEFLHMMKSYKYILPIILFEIVLGYTGVLRADVNTIMNATIEFMFFFLILYLLKTVISIEKFIKIIRGCAYVLCILGMQEYATGVNLFHKLQTLDANFSQYIRSGSVRIMGQCGHALAYGLLLLLFLPIACINLEDKKIDILKNKVLFILITINVFLTGSRSALSLFVVEVFVLFIFSHKDEKKKVILFMLVILFVMVAFIIALPGNSISRYIMLQITSVIDTILGTSYSISYGAEIDRLNNSSYYRTVLPKVFFVSYLNPILGRGVSRRSSFQVADISIISIDNFYVAQYIRYAYPGLISFMWFVLANGVDLLRSFFTRKKGIYLAGFIALTCYFVNLWWMDSLQTLRYAYAIFALMYVYMENENPDIVLKGNEEKKHESKYIRR